MDNTQTICLLNDSFPPLIDGVANTVLNYASQIQRSGLQSMVVTPANPERMISNFHIQLSGIPVS